MVEFIVDKMTQFTILKMTKFTITKSLSEPRKWLAVAPNN
jgi:hypothetical protein